MSRSVSFINPHTRRRWTRVLWTEFNEKQQTDPSTLAQTSEVHHSVPKTRILLTNLLYRLNEKVILINICHLSFCQVNWENILLILQMFIYINTSKITTGLLYFSFLHKNTLLFWEHWLVSNLCLPSIHLRMIYSLWLVIRSG